MIPKNGKPYLWVTWITGLLSGEDKCAYRVWVKAKFNYDKPPKDPSDAERLKSWVEVHDKMVQRRVGQLRAEGYQVLVEQEAKFLLEGDVAKIGGQPDITAVRQGEPVLVVDEKSGKMKDRYIWQVLLYMFAMTLTKFKGREMRGEVEYTDNNIISVPPRQLSQDNKVRIGKTIKLVSQDDPPDPAPSIYECQYCDVLECQYRFKETGDASRYF